MCTDNTFYNNRYKYFLMIIIFLIILLVPSICLSEKITVEAEGYHYVENGETLEVAQDNALKESLRWAVEQVGVRLSSYTEVVNQMVISDEVEVLASALVQVREKKFEPVIEGNRIKIIARIVAVIDTSDLDKWSPPDIERRKQLEKDNGELKEEIDRMKQESLIRSIGTAGGSTAMVVVKVLEKVQPLMNNGDYQVADQVLSDAIKGGVEHAELYYQRGWCDIAFRQYSAAILDFERAFKLSNEPRYLKARGDAYYKLGKYDLALQDYNRVLAKNPEDSTTIANLGAVYWSIGNAQEAVKNYDKAFSLGLEMAGRIRYTLEGQYEKGTMIIKKTARKTLPLC